jgi:hypothetical protein
VINRLRQVEGADHEYVRVYEAPRWRARRFVTNRLHALQDENAVLQRQAADLTRHNESLRKRKMLEKHMRENTC